MRRSPMHTIELLNATMWQPARLDLAKSCNEETIGSHQKWSSNARCLAAMQVARSSCWLHVGVRTSKRCNSCELLHEDQRLRTLIALVHVLNPFPDLGRPLSDGHGCRSADATLSPSRVSAGPRQTRRSRSQKRCAIDAAYHLRATQHKCLVIEYAVCAQTTSCMMTRFASC